MILAAEAWQPVIFGGMIPLLGACAVFGLIWYAVRKPPEEDGEAEEETKKGRP
ncbi:MAG TPA: hypothetical protein VF731_12920 [Solirubrobacterales bacterium]